MTKWITGFLISLVERIEVVVDVTTTGFSVGFVRRVAAGFQFFEKNQEVKMVTLAADKKRKLSIKVVDAKGRPATLDGIPAWSVSVEGAVSLFPSADGLECEMAWVGPNAGVVVTVKGDADLGEGVKEIIGTLDVQCLAAEAARFDLTVSEEQDA